MPNSTSLRQPEPNNISFTFNMNFHLIVSISCNLLLWIWISSLEAGAPYDRIHFVPAARADMNKLHLCGMDHGEKLYLGRLTIESGDQIPANLYPENDYDRVIFSHAGRMRYVPKRAYQEYKVEFLQQTTTGGISWYFTHRRFNEDPGRRLNLTVSVGRLRTGERVFVCRGINENGKLLIGRHIENQEGCIVHGNPNNYLEYFEVMGISFLGQHQGGKRIFDSTTDYCNKWRNCF